MERKENDIMEQNSQIISKEKYRRNLKFVVSETILTSNAGNWIKTICKNDKRKKLIYNLTYYK